MKYTTILFDLDGTLIDTNELIISSYMHTLQHFFPEQQHEREKIIALMGKTLLDSMRFFDSERAEEMIEVYREHNIRTHNEMVVAFPHVKDVLAQLHSNGLKLGIVTTKQRNTAQMGIDLCELNEYISTIVTIQDVENPKPHPEPVLKAMAELGALAPSTLMVGDSRYDIEAAQRAGIDSAGVAWSIRGEEYLKQFSPTYMLQSIQDLLRIVEE